MKEIKTIYYENKNQSESLNRFYVYINEHTKNENDIILKCQYVCGIPFQDEVNDTHYMIPGLIVIDILCKKAIMQSPQVQKSTEKKLVIFSSGILTTTYVLCFEDIDGKYYELKCKDYFITNTKGYYKIDDKYVSVVKYREMQKRKNS